MSRHEGALPTEPRAALVPAVSPSTVEPSLTRVLIAMRRSQASGAADGAAFEQSEEVRLYRERLRALMADLLLAEEKERRRLAVDLHDGLSQTIALTQIKLAALRRA